MSSADLLKEADLCITENPQRAEQLYKQILSNTGAFRHPKSLTERSNGNSDVE